MVLICVYNISKKSRVKFSSGEYIKVMINEMTPKVKAVQKMQDYIDVHLSFPFKRISL